MEFATTLWKARWLWLRILITSVIPCLLLSYYQVNDIKIEINDMSPWLGRHLSSSPFSVNFFCFLIIAISQFLGNKSLREAVLSRIPLNETGLLTFLRVLERPVQKKLDRFTSVAHELLSDERQDVQYSDSEIFCKITKPLEQMACILESIYQFYIGIDSDDARFKIVLYFVERGRLLEKPLLYSPSDCHPTTPIRLLSNSRSPIMTAIRLKKLCLIEDISKPPSGVEFIRGDDRERTGSLLCYPVTVQHIGEVRMVISILCEGRANYFKKGNSKIYNFVFEKFRNRLVIEYGLYMLTLKANCAGGYHGE
jgi:hypothetical protein